MPKVALPAIVWYQCPFCKAKMEPYRKAQHCDKCGQYVKFPKV